MFLKNIDKCNIRISDQWDLEKKWGQNHCLPAIEPRRFKPSFARTLQNNALNFFSISYARQ
jgi:hypothetical protein